MQATKYEQPRYKLESGTYSTRYHSFEIAREEARRVGVARCEIARVIDTRSGEVVYEF